MCSDRNGIRESHGHSPPMSCLRSYLMRLHIMIYGLLVLGACEEKKSSSLATRSSQIHIAQPTMGSCLNISLTVPSSGEGDMKPGVCPDTLTQNSNTIKKIKACDSYQDTANDDPNTYQWIMYDGKIDAEGRKTAQTLEQANSNCKDLLDSVNGR